MRLLRPCLVFSVDGDLKTTGASMSAMLYDQDFHAWTQEQARLLKTGEVSRLDELPD